MKQLFFQEDSFNPFEGEKFESEFLSRMGSAYVRLMSINQANEVEHHQLFDLLVSSSRSWNHVMSLPLLPQPNAVKHVAVPFNIEDHDSIDFMGGVLSDYIEKFINQTLSECKYIFSCDPRHFVAAEISHFDYGVAFRLAQNGGGNTDFVIFDRSFSTWMTYSTDRPFVIITQREDCGSPEDISGITDACWQDFFSENINDAAKGCSRWYLEIFNKTYIPRLPGFSEISAANNVSPHSS